MADRERSEDLVTLDVALLRAELRDALQEILPELVPSPPPASLNADELAAALVRRLPRSAPGADREAVETVRRQVAGKSASEAHLPSRGRRQRRQSHAPDRITSEDHSSPNKP